jgi:pilus assembly protein CpaB
VVEVPVPERPVPVGAMLRDAPLRLEKYPEHQLPRGVVREMAAVRERVALVALPAGLPIVNENIGSLDEASNPILGHILPGMRAMTVRVDATTSVEGWVRGGSIVDVLLVEKGKTSVVAEKVKVISAERSLSPLDGGSGPTVPSTVTLLVTQEQCLAINTAVPLGKISFALRSSRDIDSWRDTKFSPDDLSPSIGGAKIEGMVSVGSGSDERRFALVNGAWLPAESVPDGFLLKNRSE